MLTDFELNFLLGDYNDAYGAVDAADYVALRNTSMALVKATTPGAAHFGQSVGSGANSNSIVPEPAAALLLVLGRP